MNNIFYDVDETECFPPSRETPASQLCDGSLRAGLTVVSYGGGDDFSIAPCALHHTFVECFKPTNTLKQRVKSAVRSALHKESQDADMLEIKGLCAADSVMWDSAEWTREVVLTGAPRPTETSSEDELMHINLFYHGWLWATDVDYRDDAKTTMYPLIGLLVACGGLEHCAPGSLGPMREDSLLPADGTLQATDAHFHDGASLGANMACVNLRGGDVGAGVSVCINVSNPSAPRVRLSHLIVLPRTTDYMAAVSAIDNAAVVSENVNSLLQRVVIAVPSLGALLDWNSMQMLESSLAAARANGMPRHGTKSAVACAQNPNFWVNFDDETPVQPDEKVFRVESNIFLASEYGAIASEVFNVLKIGAVVNLVPGGHTNVPDAFKGKLVGMVDTIDTAGVFSGLPVVEYLSMQVHDQAGQDLKDPLDIILPTVDSWLAQGRRILIHCSAGLSRSVSVVIAILMTRHKLSLAEAVRKVTCTRGRKLQCNMGFWMQLVSMEHELRARLEGPSTLFAPPSLNVLPWIMEDSKRFFNDSSSEALEDIESRIVAAFVYANYDFNKFMDKLLLS